MFDFLFDSAFIVVKDKDATRNDKIYIQDHRIVMETGIQGKGLWEGTTINLRFRELIKNDTFNLKFKVYLKDFESGFRAGPGGEFYVDFYVSQYMEIWTLMFQWGVPNYVLPPNPDRKASMAFMSYNNDANWLNPDFDVFSYVGFGKRYLYLPTNT